MSTQFFNLKAPCPLDNCHEGEGSLVFYDLIKDNQQTGYIKFVHRDILKTGVSIGNHTHTGSDSEPCEEWYYCISGRGVMFLDGEEFDFNPGDICVCRHGGTHGLKNPYHEDLEILVFYAER